MRCVRCRAQNAPDSTSCWACGVQLPANGRARKHVGLRLEAMRYYDAGSATLGQRRAWVDGVVLLSTVLFGVLVAYFLADVWPAARSPADASRSLFTFRNLFGLAALTYHTLPVRPVGEAQNVRGVVVQVIDPRRARAEAGREAPAGSSLLVLTAIVDNQTRQPFAFERGEWRVRDARGRSLPAEPISAAGWLSSGSLNPGQQVMAGIGFLVPDGETDLQATFSPAALRTVLRWLVKA